MGLSNARIEDADDVNLESQRDLRRLTAHQFSDRINAMLEQNPHLVRDVAALPPAGWFDDGTGSIRWCDSLRWTEHVHEALAKAAVPTHPRVSTPAGWYDDRYDRQRWWTGQHRT